MKGELEKVQDHLIREGQATEAVIGAHLNTFNVGREKTQTKYQYTDQLGYDIDRTQEDLVDFILANVRAVYSAKNTVKPKTENMEEKKEEVAKATPLVWSSERKGGDLTLSNDDTTVTKEHEGSYHAVCADRVLT
jgi:phage I-like protein